MGERRGMKALETWCRRVTRGYPGVRITNMTTSWRNGLAFCAIIHHFRPDLIDFDSLRAEDILANNSLAFEVAETALGVASLLDPQDMVDVATPDRLSVLTYVSQYYQAFHTLTGVARSVDPDSSTATEADEAKIASIEENQQQSTTPLQTRAATSVADGCVVCRLPVFLAQRLMVERRLLHRTCFRCDRCHSQMSTANYYITEQGGYCCEVCPDEQSDIPSRQQPEPSAAAADSRLVTSSTVDDVTADDVSGGSSSDSDGAAEVEIVAVATHSSATEVAQKHPASDNDQRSCDDVRSAPPVLADSDSCDDRLLRDTAAVCESAGESERSVSDSVRQSGPGLSLGELSTAREKQSGSELNPGEHSTARERRSLPELNPEELSYARARQSLPELSSGELSSTQPPIAAPRTSLLTEVSAVEGDHRGCTEHQDNVGIAESVQAEEKVEDDPEHRAGGLDQVVVSESVQAEETVEDGRTEDQDKVVVAGVEQEGTADEKADGNSTESEENIKELRQSCSEKDRDDVETADDWKQDEEIDIPKSSTHSVVVDPPASASDVSVEDHKAGNSCEDSTHSLIQQPGQQRDDGAADTETADEVDVVKEYNPFEDEVEEESVGGQTAHDVESKTEPADSVEVRDQDLDRLDGLDYPDELNPFGDDEVEEDPAAEKKEEIHKDYNPFEGDPAESASRPGSAAPPKPPRITTGRDLNPFERPPRPPPPVLSRNPSSATRSPRLQHNRTPEPGLQRSGSQTSLLSVTSSGGRKKRPAPQPPGLHTPPSSRAANSQGSSPVVIRPAAVQSTVGPAKAAKELDNYNRLGTVNKSTAGQWKRRKGPAPPLPAPVKRQVRNVPLKEIQTELHDIGVQQLELERQGVELEQTIRQLSHIEHTDKTTANADECDGGSAGVSYGLDVEDMIIQLFDLVNERNSLFRRQAELMYMRRQHRLEEEHAELEFEIRCLMQKSDSQKNDDERQREQQLIDRLVSVVEQRDQVVTVLEMERQREIQEDATIDLHIGLYAAEKNGSLEPEKVKKKDKKKKKKHKDKEGVEVDKKSKKKKSPDEDKDIDEKEKEMSRKKSAKIKLKKLFT